MSILNPLTASDNIETWFTRTNQGITFLNYINKGVRPPVRDIISIKDVVFAGLSAAGDGIKNDAFIIQKTLSTNSADKVFVPSRGITLNPINEGFGIYFPPGVYRMDDFSVTFMTDKTNPKQNLYLFGHKAKILFNPSISLAGSAFSRTAIFLVTHTGKNIVIDGIEFDANNKTKVCVELQDQGGGESSLIDIKNCSFNNTRSSSSNNSSLDTNSGLYIQGGSVYTNIQNCKFINHTRSKGSGFPRVRTTAGLLFSSIGSFPNIKINRNVNISGCYFENITNEDIGNDEKNTDCDAITLIGGLDTSTLKYSGYAATISNNHFRNCKGRSLKIQGNMISFTNNYVYRNIPALQTGFAEVNAQAHTALNLCNNVFVYDQIAGGGSPFSNDGSTSPLSVVFDCSSGEFGKEKTVSVRDNIVLNNVPKTVGALSGFFACRFSPKIVEPLDYMVTVTGNKVIGGTIQFFGQVNTLTSADTNKVYYNIHDNMMTEIGDVAGKTFAFLSGQGSDAFTGFSKNNFNITNNVHAASKTIKSLISPDSLVTYEANISAYNNINIGVSLSSSLGDTVNTHNTQKSFIPRISKLTDDSAKGNAICSQTVELSDDAPYHTFASCGDQNSGKIRMITSNWGHPGTFIFAQNGTSNTHIPAGFTGADIAVQTDITSSTDGKLNVVFNNGDVSVRNRLGSARNISLHTFG